MKWASYSSDITVGETDADAGAENTLDVNPYYMKFTQIIICVATPEKRKKFEKFEYFAHFFHRLRKCLWFLEGCSVSGITAQFHGSVFILFSVVFL